MGRTHGMHGSPTYEAWKAMLQRCRNPNYHHWRDYGGRGITVCERWLTFANFLADMGKRPEGRSLGRIDNNKGYSPNNCRWETREQQMNNTRKTGTFPNVHRYRDKWAARIRIDGKRVFLGYAATPFKAYLMRFRAAAVRGMTLPEGDYLLRDYLLRKFAGSPAMQDRQPSAKLPAGQV
jgi:hypothetical protein